MDWLRFIVAVMGVLYVLNAAMAVRQVGRERDNKPISSASAGCTVLLCMGMLVVTLLVWQRLGGG